MTKDRPMTREPIEALRTILKEVWGCEMELSFPRIGNALNAVSDEIDRLKARCEALEILLTDLKVSSATVEASWPHRVAGEYEHWNACIDAASGYLAKDNLAPINEAALSPTEEPALGELISQTEVESHHLSAPALPADVAALVEELRSHRNLDCGCWLCELLEKAAAALSARRVGVGVEDVAGIIAWRAKIADVGPPINDRYVSNTKELAALILALGQPEITVQQEDER